VAESWVINASPTILLAKAGLMELIPKLTTRFVIPQPVVEEILNVRGKDAAAKWLQQSGKQFIQPAVAGFPALASSEIGPGERAVISWAMAHPGFVAVLDDFEARVIAQKLGVPLIGTVGVILRLKKAGLISAAKPHLQNIRNAGGYIGDKLFAAALKQAGENL
jgi:predicted nucleic acid-binding protein